MLSKRVNPTHPPAFNKPVAPGRAAAHLKPTTVSSSSVAPVGWDEVRMRSITDAVFEFWNFCVEFYCSITCFQRSRASRRVQPVSFLKIAMSSGAMGCAEGHDPTHERGA